MDWRVVAGTFATVFVAELGDKTQLATLALAAESGKRWAVFVGSALALVLAALFGALLGGWLNTRVGPRALGILGGLLFLAVGAWMLVRALAASPLPNA